ncbi:MAG: biliverdin-producing heme oxygenase [Phycisphaerales bacterium]|nr:biliverdin-producing heme oxygenase [Phycisphaerales bacterium]
MIATPDVMTLLRESTAAHHQRAEGHRFQRALAKGDLETAGYVAWLGQMRLVHAGLESALTRLLQAEPALADLLGDDWRKVPHLEADLAHFGAEPRDVAPLPGTARLLDEIASLLATEPRALLGMYYVLEGSTNGGRYIARGVRRTFGLETRGVSYLDPYGESQREHWLGFKSRMGALAIGDEEAHAMVAAAQTMFDGIAALSEDLAASAL